MGLGEETTRTWDGWGTKPIGHGTVRRGALRAPPHGTCTGAKAGLAYAKADYPIKS